MYLYSNPQPRLETMCLDDFRVRLFGVFQFPAGITVIEHTFTVPLEHQSACNAYISTVVTSDPSGVRRSAVSEPPIRFPYDGAAGHLTVCF